MTVTEDAPITGLSRLIADRAAARPDAAALLAPDRTPLTYRALAERTEEIGQALNTFGIGRPHRVALVLPNGPDLATAFLGTAAYAQSAPLNPAYREQEFAFYLADMRADVLLIEAGDDSPAVAVARELGLRVIELSSRPGTPAGVFELHCADPGTPVAATDGGPAGPEDTALILHTSGTTDRPKLVPLTHANLHVAARNTGAAFALDERDLCLNPMPLFHAHGLTSTLLATLVRGAGIVCTPGFSDTGFYSWLEQFRPTWYTAVPAMHQALLSVADDHREVLAASRLRFIRSASAPLPGPTLTALEEAFHAPVIEAYGMTEAGSLVTSNPLPPGRRKLRSVGLPVGGPVAVLDKAGHPVPVGESGEIAIRGANVMAGYEANPEANSRAFTNGWLRTGDEGRLDEDGYLYVVGRSKEIINRGGSKVAPVEIDDVLAGHPTVKLAVAFGVPHPTLGEDVAVAVVPRPGALVVERDLREYARERLADFKVPSRVFVVDDVPRSPTGKVQRLRLAERLATAAAAAAASGHRAAPADPLARRIAAVWAEVLGTEEFGTEDNFFDLGGNSLLLKRVAARLGEQLGREVKLLTLTMCPTVETLAAHLAEERGGSDGPAAAAPDARDRLDRGRDRLRRQLDRRRAGARKENS
ncbi:non-ribosomal peptide synthetase [Kitasatospora aureofaciens]|uniref:non-ribosomal peptide synthetase n=1 Tax=Kitasatospora aureofaciens TaxID=1894 RepID=UPI0007C484BF|nr:non-ribosomal peptide synthetase [Kitasatospora aureofaciens]